jgi:hypothetical protein
LLRSASVIYQHQQQQQQGPVTRHRQRRFVKTLENTKVNGYYAKNRPRTTVPEPIRVTGIEKFMADLE